MNDNSDEVNKEEQLEEACEHFRTSWVMQGTSVHVQQLGAALRYVLCAFWASLERPPVTRALTTSLCISPPNVRYIVVFERF